MELIKRHRSHLIKAKEDKFYILIAIKWPNPESRRVTVGYFQKGEFRDSLKNQLYFDDGFEAQVIPTEYVEWWAEMPEYEVLNN